jgi:hypothetical protein
VRTLESTSGVKLLHMKIKAYKTVCQSCITEHIRKVCHNHLSPKSCTIRHMEKLFCNVKTSLLFDYLLHRFVKIVVLGMIPSSRLQGCSDPLAQRCNSLYHISMCITLCAKQIEKKAINVQATQNSSGQPLSQTKSHDFACLLLQGDCGSQQDTYWP